MDVTVFLFRLLFHPIIPNYRYHIKNENFFRQPPLPSGKLGEEELLSKNINLFLHFDNFISVHQAHIRPAGEPESTSQGTP